MFDIMEIYSRLLAIPPPEKLGGTFFTYIIHEMLSLLFLNLIQEHVLVWSVV